jgi:hypothetical protein
MPKHNSSDHQSPASYRSRSSNNPSVFGRTGHVDGIPKSMQVARGLALPIDTPYVPPDDDPYMSHRMAAGDTTLNNYVDMAIPLNATNSLGESGQSTFVNGANSDIVGAATSIPHHGCNSGLGADCHSISSLEGALEPAPSTWTAVHGPATPISFNSGASSPCKSVPSPISDGRTAARAAVLAANKGNQAAFLQEPGSFWIKGTKSEKPRNRLPKALSFEAISGTVKTRAEQLFAGLRTEPLFRHTANSTALAVSVPPAMQAAFYSQLELVALGAISDFLLLNINLLRIKVLKKEVEAWEGGDWNMTMGFKEKHQKVTSFMFPLEAQARIMEAHVDVFLAKGSFNLKEAALIHQASSIVKAWGGISRAMSQKTLCFPDWLVMDHVKGTERFLRLLGEKVICDEHARRFATWKKRVVAVILCQEDIVGTSPVSLTEYDYDSEWVESPTRGELDPANANLQAAAEERQQAERDLLQALGVIGSDKIVEVAEVREFHVDSAPHDTSYMESW